MSPDEIRAADAGRVGRVLQPAADLEALAAAVEALRARLAFVLISKLYRQMYANTGIATDSARVSRANRWARLIAKPCRRVFVASPMPALVAPAGTSRPRPMAVPDIRSASTDGIGPGRSLLVNHSHG